MQTDTFITGNLLYTHSTRRSTKKVRQSQGPNGSCKLVCLPRFDRLPLPVLTVAANLGTKYTEFFKSLYWWWREWGLKNRIKISSKWKCNNGAFYQLDNYSTAFLMSSNLHLNWGKTGNGSVLINNSKFSLLNHRPAVIWKILALGLFSVTNEAHSWASACDFPEFVRVWWVISGQSFLTIIGQSIPRHKAHHVVSIFQLNTWSRSVGDEKARAELSCVRTLECVHCTMTNSCWQLRFGQNLLTLRFRNTAVNALFLHYTPILNKNYVFAVWTSNKPYTLTSLHLLWL